MNTSNPAKKLSELHALAESIHNAADSQEWGLLDELLATFNTQVRTIDLSRKHAPQIAAMLELINQAQALASARKNEIGRLLDALSGK